MKSYLVASLILGFASITEAQYLAPDDRYPWLFEPDGSISVFIPDEEVKKSEKYEDYFKSWISIRGVWGGDFVSVIVDGEKKEVKIEEIRELVDRIHQIGKKSGLAERPSALERGVITAIYGKSEGRNWRIDMGTEKSMKIREPILQILREFLKGVNERNRASNSNGEVQQGAAG